jgi:small subunit ribosomal protein S18
LATDTQGQRPPSRNRRSGPPSGNDQRGGRRGYGRPPSRRKCAYCVNKALKIDYKRVDVLQNYVTERGKISGRRGTALCAMHQRELAVAVKRARHLALLPFASEHLRKG